MAADTVSAGQDWPTGELVCVFMGVQGYKKLSAEDAEVAEAALKMMDELVEREMRAGGGYRGAKTKISASYFYVFRTVAEAVRASLNVQRGLLGLPWPEAMLQYASMGEVKNEDGVVVFRGLRLRAGIHVGEPRLEKAEDGSHTYTGAVCGNTARIGTVATGGQVVLSAEALQKGHAEAEADGGAEAAAAQEEAWSGMLAELGVAVEKLGSFTMKSAVVEVWVFAQLPPNERTFDKPHPSDDPWWQFSPNVSLPPVDTSKGVEEAAVRAVMSKRGSGLNLSSDPAKGAETSGCEIWGKYWDESPEHPWANIDPSTVAMSGKFGSHAVQLFECYYTARDQEKRRCELQKPGVSFSAAHEAFIKEKYDQLGSLDHPNVQKFIGIVWHPNRQLWEIFELVKAPMLYAVLHDRSKVLPWINRVHIATGLASALGYLHNQRLMYRDLKSTSIKLVEDKRPVLFDFTVAKSIPETASVDASDAMINSLVGTSYWLAPEIMNGQPYAYSADLYSYGIILWEVAAREDPYGQDATLASITKAVAAGVRPDVSPAWPRAFVRVMETSWETDPSHRKDGAWCVEQLQALSAEELAKADKSSPSAPTRTVSVSVVPIQSGVGLAVAPREAQRDRAQLATMHEVQKSESKLCAIL